MTGSTSLYAIYVETRGANVGGGSAQPATNRQPARRKMRGLFFGLIGRWAWIGCRRGRIQNGRM
jgi:hypothetical protein